MIFRHRDEGEVCAGGLFVLKQSRVSLFLVPEQRRAKQEPTSKQEQANENKQTKTNEDENGTNRDSRDCKDCKDAETQNLHSTLRNHPQLPSLRLAWIRPWSAAFKNRLPAVDLDRPATLYRNAAAVRNTEKLLVLTT